MPDWLVQFQALLLNPPHIIYAPSSVLISVIPLPDPSSDVQHDRSIILGFIQSIMLDLTVIPWPHTDWIYFTDLSSFIQNGIRYAEAAVLDLDSVIWMTALPLGTSAQKAELKALTQA